MNLYLQEEGQTEALTRNIQGFTQFLDAIALSNGEEIYYQSLSSDCGIPARMLKNYIEILEDALVGYRPKAFTLTKKRKIASCRLQGLDPYGYLVDVLQHIDTYPACEVHLLPHTALEGALRRSPAAFRSRPPLQEHR